MWKKYSGQNNAWSALCQADFQAARGNNSFRIEVIEIKRDRPGNSLWPASVLPFFAHNKCSKYNYEFKMRVNENLFFAWNLRPVLWNVSLFCSPSNSNREIRFIISPFSITFANCFIVIKTIYYIYVVNYYERYLTFFIVFRSFGYLFILVIIEYRVSWEYFLRSIIPSFA